MSKKAEQVASVKIPKSFLDPYWSDLKFYLMKRKLLKKINRRTRPIFPKSSHFFERAVLALKIGGKFRKKKAS